MIPADLTKKLAFVIITESGILEKKSVMMVKTLRNYGGRFKDCPILSYSPRDGRIPGRKTLQIFQELGVEAILDPLNDQFEEDCFANKIVACVHADTTYNYERLVYLDSDMFILQEPRLLWSDDPQVVKLRPVEQKKAGSTGSDEHADFWSALFKITGVTDPVYVTATLTGDKIYGYWNGGVISAPAGTGFFTDWYDDYKVLLRSGLLDPKWKSFPEQMTIGMGIHRGTYELEELPVRYNYPINTAAQPPRQGEIQGLHHIVIAHYHKVLDRRPLKNPLSNWLRESRDYEHLAIVMSESGLYGLGENLKYNLGRMGQRVAGVVSRLT